MIGQTKRYYVRLSNGIDSDVEVAENYIDVLQTILDSQFLNLQTGATAIKRNFIGGRGGIRTHERLRVGSFQDCCIQPLCHPSER